VPHDAQIVGQTILAAAGFQPAFTWQEDQPGREKAAIKAAAGKIACPTIYTYIRDAKSVRRPPGEAVRPRQSRSQRLYA
jgi:hypothetical protein